MQTLIDKLAHYRLMPVIEIADADSAVELAAVLCDNGLPCAEITFRTPAVESAISSMRRAFPDMLIGAGTVLTTEQVDSAIRCGVDFIVSPGFNPPIVAYCQQREMPIMPGVNSPSLVEQAMSMGLMYLKYFPAEISGGVAMLKALAAVYPAKFMPTGGINADNISDYLAQRNVVACGGTWMVPSALIKRQQWDELGELIREALATLPPHTPVA